jgi:hypothetical protein
LKNYVNGEFRRMMEEVFMTVAIHHPSILLGIRKERGSG